MMAGKGQSDEKVLTLQFYELVVIIICVWIL